LTDQGHADEAIPHFEQALTLQPQYARAHFRLGLALYELRRSPSAVDHLNKAIVLRPDSVEMLWHTAWILATCPDPSIRNGARGFALARRAIELSDGKEVRAYDALAAALAEIGKFSAAVEASERASKLARARNDDALVGAIEQRTRLYRQGLPYRESESPLPAEHAPPAAAE
jgi:serine/threonine-protein kinase